MGRKNLSYFVSFVLFVVCFSWTSLSSQAPPVFSKLPSNQWPPARKAGPTSPALSPEEEMKTFSVPPGYRVELVAAEPLLDAPILIDFDPDGRLWVVETPAFLPDLSGRDSREPINRVVVLEDTDNDGRMDKRTVFADGLVMPRAIKALEGGAALVGEPPNLWLMKDTNGDLKSDSKERVTDTYGNANAGIEHNANSTLWAMDNIIYSSEHTWNIRWKGARASGSERAAGAARGEGVPASAGVGGAAGAQPPGSMFDAIPTLSRGQWQISQDDAGRIYRNVNDSPLFVDYTPAHYYLRNPNGARTRGLYELLIEQMDATVYPVRPTRGVNRGYRDEYFRADGSSIVIQGTSGPAIYRGDKYPASARGNAFIADSTTNLVHQMAVVDDGTGKLTAKNVYPRGEFFASSDERCRPVIAYSAPDGNMYIVDMYRGVVQAGGLWSDYLTSYIKANELQLPVAKGRIWRVVYGTGANTRGPKPSLSTATPAQLVQTLSHANGWWRDTAQQLLIRKNEVSIAPQLKQLAGAAPDWRTKVHALWTLEGLDQLDPATVEKALADPSADVRAAGLRLSERWLPSTSIGPGSANAMAAAVAKLAADRNWNVRRQYAASIGELPGAAKVDAAVAVLARDGSDPIIVDTLISGLKGVEADVLRRMAQSGAAPAAGTAAPNEAVTMLAAAVAKSGDAGAVQGLIDMAVDASQPTWRRAAVLRGLDTGLPAAGAGGRGGRGGGGGGGLPGLSTPGGRVVVTPGRGVSLPAEPSALVRVSAENSDVGLRARAVVAKLSWTGKPAPAAPAVQPLTAADQQRVDAGKQVFANLCAGCHDVNGQGKDKLGPSLVTSKYTPANPQIAIRILTGGKDGPMGLMPPVTGTLTDAQIAAVISYVRREWGNGASMVSEIDVRELRQSTSWHKGPWTEAELSGMVGGGGRGRGGAQ
jgi:putative membrane-bound dehydrogenase-like protein